mgnify:CR=1 FL=1
MGEVVISQQQDFVHTILKMKKSRVVCNGILVLYNIHVGANQTNGSVLFEVIKLDLQ